MSTTFEIILLVFISLLLSLFISVLSEIFSIMTDYALFKEKGFKTKIRGLEIENKVALSFPIILFSILAGYSFGYFVGYYWDIFEELFFYS